MNDTTALLETLLGSDMYRDYARAFSDATGLPLTLRAVDAWQPPLRGKAKENGFCALMAKQSASCAACLRMQEQLSGAATNGPVMLKCEFGLTEAAVPVKLGEQMIGYLVTGQVFVQAPSPERFGKVENTMKELGIKANAKDAKKAYFETRVMSRSQLDAALRLLANFAEHLALKSNQIATHQANAEPVAVVRAKAYIREHLQDDITLSDVARAACTSSFYICKLFKKTTGLNLTEYISRLRIERTMELLPNPNLRISEIAFEVGFQSLTHFNRVFRQIVGEAPTTHRESLALAA
jgi:AraC-like DNA-binding protein/ligand-binding sensor protein